MYYAHNRDACGHGGEGAAGGVAGGGGARV
jgi:hypothetical protein